ncbi:Homeobox protein HOX1A [Phytophthora citrophthora]|uniref:Homeobox protein HOX1A n=1 Tax=Phytophthora citrophthora TaxID=4793 RepID=A0AAD9LPM0_9STRA|nr:Homeobox protein HOX1A [Phytophthora citrophthora]
MARTRKKARSSSESDDAYTPSASARRPSITVKPRKQRDRRAPTAFSPTADTPPPKARKPKESSPVKDGDVPTATATPARPEHKRLENKIKSQAHRLRYPLAFIEAYEADGWNKSSRDKLKPSKELEVEHRKISKGKRALIDGLGELKALYANEPQVPLMAKFEEVHCSRCGSTDIEQDNDILLCDSIGCHRAYHQQCQTPVVLTAKIPVGEEPWFCEVCLAIFECLKSINSVFGTTFESIDDLFPELNEEQQVTPDGSSAAQSGEESATAPAEADDEEEDDEDFVFSEEDDEDGEEEEDDDKTEGEIAGDGEEMAEEVPESAQDLLYLSKDDVIDLDHRSTRSKSVNLLSKPVHTKPQLIGEPAAKIDPKTGDVILGVVAMLEPPAPGRYSRWRIDYCDGSSELLTRSKTQAAINRAAVENSDDEEEGVDPETNAKLIVRGKRKRTDVDYRQLNEMMFAGKDEDSENDETFEVKEGSEEEPDEEEDNEDDNEEDKEEADEGEMGDKSAESESGQSSPTAITEPHDTKLPLLPVQKRSQRQRADVDYLSMHEGLLS